MNTVFKTTPVIAPYVTIDIEHATNRQLNYIAATSLGYAYLGEDAYGHRMRKENVSVYLSCMKFSTDYYFAMPFIEKYKPDLEWRNGSWRASFFTDAPFARLQFCYGDTLIVAGLRAAMIKLFDRRIFNIPKGV